MEAAIYRILDAQKDQKPKMAKWTEYFKCNMKPFKAMVEGPVKRTQNNFITAISTSMIVVEVASEEKSAAPYLLFMAEKEGGDGGRYIFVSGHSKASAQ